MNDTKTSRKITFDAKDPKPLYRQLSDFIMEQIISGQLKAGDKLPSENEMLDTFNVGRQTIRNALALLVNEGFLSKSKGKGTFVTGSSSLRQTQNIEVLLDMTDNYFIPYYVHGISDVLSENGFNFLISDTKDSDEILCCLLENIAMKGSSGVLLQYTGPSEPGKYAERLIKYLNLLSKKGLPIIILDGNIDEPQLPCFTVDEFSGGHRAAEHLAAYGHKKCAMISLDRHRDSRLRCEGFVAGAARFHMETPQIVFATGLWEEDLDGLIKKGVTGIFAYNDNAAIRCIMALKRRGYKIPEDVSVIGFDDSSLASTSDPPLTALVHPKELIGREAADMLIRIIRSGERNKQGKLYRVELAMRDSVGPPRCV